MVSIEQYRLFYINNPPGPQQVTVTNLPLDGYITNFPTIQNVAGTIEVSNLDEVSVAVEVSNFPTSFEVSNFPTSFDVSNFPLVQDGYITNFPDVQEITGTINVIDPLTSAQNGNWNYSAGINGTVIISGSKKIRGIIVHSTDGGDFTINGGDTITVPANVGVEINPQGLLVDPTIVFSAGIDSYFIEYVT